MTTALLGAVSCGGGSSSDNGTTTPPGAPAAATVRMLATTFEPENVTVKVDETVRWVWEGGVQHNVNARGKFKSELKSKGDFRYTFKEPGTVEFICDVHPTTMKGKVEVTT